MTGTPLAHSARPDRGISSQPFWQHVDRVTAVAVENASSGSAFWTGDRNGFIAEVEAAARFHDCGKLAPENQAVLGHSAKGGLPVRHEDAGAAWLLEKRREKAALLVASHHAGLLSLLEEKKKPLLKPAGRKYRITEAVNHTTEHLAEYIAQYRQAGMSEVLEGAITAKWSGLAKRFALSCLVDADHSDTARHYGEPLPKKPAECSWTERADALDAYVRVLGSDRNTDVRNEDRQRVYECCRNAMPAEGIVSCDAAVGSGKTTAVMAHLLRVAKERGLRHIFVVLPYTNIIQQSVDVYRRALTLPGEDPADVVAAVHHRAEFQDPESRQMSVLWNAPITVTTAVQFFETLAGNRPARLRKLHELPGSAVFVDEAHAAIPIWLWPQTWLWMKELAKDWGCHFVLASGSLAKFWTNPDVVPSPEEVPDLLTTDVRARLAEVEETRIEVCTHRELMNREELAGFVVEKPGPRLVILNTVQSAAVFAETMRSKGHHVLHLSTALAPDDRERVVQRVRARLKYSALPESGHAPNFADWTLVATSCVEAGVDFSFRTAVRESCSVASVIQTGGRVNRHGEWEASEVWDVRLQDPMFNRHPAFDASRRVLAEMLDEHLIRADASSAVTEALRRELVLREVAENAEKLRKLETLEDFPQVAEMYKVIDTDTRTVIVDLALARRLEGGERIPWRDLLSGSVQIWARKVQELSLRSVIGHEELYCWTGLYDPDFLGYMAGVLPLIQGRDTGLYA